MAGESAEADQLTARDRAILAAVATGGAELAWGAEPDLYLDGRCCSDQAAAHRLVRHDLVAPAVACAIGQRVAAVLTAAGRAALTPVLLTA
ncbi:MAG: hypothetical protein L0H84_16985 [Pseudonocardia sp.]|nr:hypothetical protein [Pseudonocardia sp.]